MKITTGNHYLAFVLDEECRQEVLKYWTASHEVIKCHHVTLAYNFSQEDIPRLQDLVDSNPSFTISYLVKSDVVDFFRVLVNGEVLETDSSSSHLTLSHKSHAEASYSSRVIKGEIPHDVYPTLGMDLTGHFELIEKKNK